tara:strand:- start:7072 stop:7611 length:540 start_codon:yes stop_codon:yes gene_type:complete
MNSNKTDSAYAHLLARYQQTEQAIKEQAKHKAEETRWMGLCFYSDDILFVTSVIGVQGVVPLQKITPMPEKHDKWLGLSAYKDKVVPIINLNKIFWGQNFERNQNARIIVYKSDEMFWGIWVSAVEGLRWFDYESQESISLDASVPYSRFVEYVCFQDEQRCAVLNMDNLINSIIEESE